MSVLAVVEEAIKLCKAEQAKINDNIRLYREILQSMKPHTQDVSEEPDNVFKEQPIPPEEEKEIELVERALKKALRIRSGAGPCKEPQGINEKYEPSKEPHCPVVKPMVAIQASGTTKGKQATLRPNSKSISLDRKAISMPRKPVTSVSVTRGTGHNSRQHKARVNVNSVQKCPVTSAKVVSLHKAQKMHQAVSSSNSHDQSDSYASISRSQYEVIRSNVSSAGDTKPGATCLSTHEEPVFVAHPEDAKTHTSPPQNREPSEIIAKWQSLRSKTNRLWDEALLMQNKPVPERNHFMERMRATFPKDCPHGSPDQIRALVDRLTHEGQELTHCYRTQQLLVNQGFSEGTEPGSKDTKYDFNMTLEQLEQMAAKLQKFAGQVKEEWEAWDRWRPHTGCLCPVRAKGEWGDGTNASLPPVVSYMTEEELRNLEKLRMKVALLQQEMYIDKVLSDALFTQLNSILNGPEQPNPSMLRDIYSLLAEGGQRFPALVLDNEPE